MQPPCDIEYILTLLEKTSLLTGVLFNAASKISPSLLQPNCLNLHHNLSVSAKLTKIHVTILIYEIVDLTKMSRN